MSGLINYAKAVAVSGWMKVVGGRGELSALGDDGAMVFPDVLPQELCASLVARIDEICDTPGHPRVWRDAQHSDSRIIGFEHVIGDEIRHFDLSRWLRAVGDYLGQQPRSWLLMANRVVPKPNNLGSGGGLHRDSPFSHQIKCIWYLSRVTSETGPFQYIPGSHKDIIGQRDRYPLGQMRFREVHDPLVEVTAEAGSLLVCDTRCIHGGKPIRTGARYAVTLYTFPGKSGARVMYERSGLDPSLCGAAPPL